MVTLLKVTGHGEQPESKAGPKSAVGTGCTVTVRTESTDPQKLVAVSVMV